MATQSLGPGLSHLLIEASQSFSADIYRRTINTSPWLKLIKQSAWPDEMGDTISVITYERTLPSTANSWDSITNDSTSTNFAVPSATSVSVAQTLRQFSLRHTAVESQPIVVNDVRMGFRFREQIKAVYDNLVENVAWLWIKRYRDEYRRISGTKVVASVSAAGSLLKSTDAFYTESLPKTTYDNTTTPANRIGILTQALLNRLYMELIRDGAGNRPMGMENGRPIFTLVCSPECSDALIRLNPSIRQDFRESSQVNELLKPLGVDRSYRGFYHLSDVTAPRYNNVFDVISFTPNTTKGLVKSANTTTKTAVVQLTLGSPSLATCVVGRCISLDAGTAAQGGSLTKGVILSATAITDGVELLVSYGGTDGAVTVGATATVLTAAGKITYFNPRTNVEITTFNTTTGAGQHFVEVPFYVPDTTAYTAGVATAAGPGTRYAVNAAYYLAEYEEAFIMHPEVMESLIPAPLTSAGSGTSFSPVNYRGDFKFLNIQHRTENPDGTWGYYRGVLASGSKPNKPQFGISLLYRRIPDVGLVVDVPALQAYNTLYTEATGAAVTTA